MKKVVAVAVLCFVLLLTCGIAFGAEDNWAIRINTGLWMPEEEQLYNKGVAYTLGVKPDALDGWDPYDDPPIGINQIASAPLTQAWCVGIHPDWGSDPLYAKDFQSPVIPASGRKLWELRIGNFTDFPGDAITVHIEFTSTNLLPPTTLGGLEILYKVFDSNMNPLSILDNTIVEGAGSSTRWLAFSVPLATIPNRESWESWNANAHTLYFAQEVVPEPASFLVLGSGLVGMIGFVRRRKTQI